MTLVGATTTRLSMIVEGNTFPMSDGTVLFDTDDGPVLLFYLTDGGLGMAPVERFSERAPSQHGVTDLGFRLLPRTVNFGFAIYAPLTDDSRHLETARDLILRRFRPTNIPITFRYDRANGTIRQIEGFFTGGLAFGSEDRLPGTWFQRLAVEVRMPDPTFYDPAEKAAFIENNANPVPVGVLIPLTVPTYVRSGVLDNDWIFANDGSWETFPIIEIFGALRSPRIENLVTGEVLYLERSSIGDGDFYTIDLNSGVKSVRHSSGEDRTHELSDDSNLATFHLAPGDQEIRVTSPYAGNQVEVVRMTWYNRFIGI